MVSFQWTVDSEQWSVKARSCYFFYCLPKRDNSLQTIAVGRRFSSGEVEWGRGRDRNEGFGGRVCGFTGLGIWSSGIRSWEVGARPS
jgi:hypothetical protein